VTMAYALGIDVGGTSIKCGLVSARGELSREASHPTPLNDPSGDALVAKIQEIVASYSEPDIACVGVAVPGIVSDDGVAEFSASLGYRGVALQSMLAGVLELPVRVVHDVTAAGVAEHRVGVAQAFQNVVVLQIGTGIAASIVLEGTPFRPHPVVGEIGHTPTSYPRPCGCGLTGCLEMTASGGALRRNYAALTGQDTTADDVFRLASEGDQVAETLYAEFLDALSGAVVWLAALLGPEAVVLSGGVASAGETLREDLARAVSQKMSFHRAPEIVLSEDHTQMGCRGAGLMAWAGT